MIYVGYIFAVALFVCCILVGVKGIQAKDTVLGIISILCGIVALVMVFTKQKEWGISNNLKLATIITFVGYLVFYGIGMATAGPVVVTQ